MESVGLDGPCLDHMWPTCVSSSLTRFPGYGRCCLCQLSPLKMLEPPGEYGHLESQACSVHSVALASAFFEPLNPKRTKDQKDLCKRLFCKQLPLVAQMVKRLPTMRETWVQSLGWEDLLEKETASHSSILA